VILRGDEMAELPTDAVNSRYRPFLTLTNSSCGGVLPEALKGMIRPPNQSVSGHLNSNEQVGDSSWDHFLCLNCAWTVWLQQLAE
jgi:hypothetical protein